ASKAHLNLVTLFAQTGSQHRGQARVVLNQQQAAFHALTRAPRTRVRALSGERHGDTTPTLILAICQPFAKSSMNSGIRCTYFENTHHTSCFPNEVPDGLRHLGPQSKEPSLHMLERKPYNSQRVVVGMAGGKTSLGITKKRGPQAKTHLDEPVPDRDCGCAQHF